MKNILIAVTTLVLVSISLYVGMQWYKKAPPQPMITPVASASIDFDEEMRELKDIQIFAWLPWWDHERVVKSLAVAGSKLHSISPVWYTLSANQQITETAEKNKDEIIREATKSGIMIIPTVNNEADEGFDGKRVGRLLTNEKMQRDVINKLVELANENNYDGWDIDWEDVKGTYKDDFTEFMKRLAEELHKNDLILTVSVHPQTGHDDYEGSQSQDWLQLPKHVDYMRIMAYDFHYSTSPPGPITPIDDLHAVLDYAVQIIPVEKIVLGVPDYGYDWVNGKGENRQYEDIIQLITSHNGQYERDDNSTALHGTYTDTQGTHEVWFEDRNSMIHKMSVGRSYGIDNFSIWRLGGDDLSFWQ